MKLSDFIYEYPRTLIAKYPAEPRDTARLMVLNREKQTIEHRRFHDIVEYFRERIAEGRKDQGGWRAH